MADRKRAIVFLAWGARHIEEVVRCLTASTLPDYERFLITDGVSAIPNMADPKLTVIRADFRTDGNLRKTELIDLLPAEYNSFVFLDSDTLVIADIEMGFLKAEKYGIAMAPSPHYSLDYGRGFDRIMEQEGVARTGQLQYNSGVIFFVLSRKVAQVFKKWRELGRKYAGVVSNDERLLTLAMELLDFNPYTLSISYNYRGCGDPISGILIHLCLSTSTSLKRPGRAAV